MKNIIIAVIFSSLALSACQEEDSVVSKEKIGACFTVSSETGDVGDEFFFTNCSKNASKFAWDFGDGGVSTQREPAHIFLQEGSFEIILLAGEDLNDDGVLDMKDDPSSFKKIVTVVDPPRACFSVSTESGKVGESLEFINCSEFATHYSWSFGDGGISDEKNPTHVYDKDGVYEVILFAGFDLNSDGLIDERDNAVSFSQTVTILPKEASAEIVVKDATTWTPSNIALPVVSGAVVEVYFSYDSFEGGVSDLTEISDQNGKVMFYDLPDNTFYYTVEKDDLSNIVNGYRVIEVFQSEEEIDSYPEQPNDPKPGDLKFADMNGDGIVTSFDEVPFAEFDVANGTITHVEAIIGK